MNFSSKAIKRPSDEPPEGSALVPSPLKIPRTGTAAGPGARAPVYVADAGYYMMYRFPPRSTAPDLGIDVLEQATLKRMHLLTKLFELDGRKVGHDFLEQAREIVDRPPFVFDFEKMDEDALGHFALRLALCISERWRQWFVKYEVILFRVRLSLMKASQQQDVLRRNNIRVEEVSEEERSQLEHQLLAVQDLEDDSRATAPESKYYKVPFQRVVRLVERRRVLLSKGMAYVPQKHIMQLVEGIYRAYLMAEVHKAAKVRATLVPAERDRVLAFLEHLVENHDSLSSAASDADKVEAGQKLDRRQVHEAAQLHFPLCMRVLDEHLHSDHHLKFTGRWQYGLFLKGVGLTLDDALEFWKTEMTKKVAPETWAKSRYAYNIRHYFGTEGKHTSYSALGCTKIILGPAPSGEMVHGCPFRHWDEATL
eukprot:RCo038044